MSRCVRRAAVRALGFMLFTASITAAVPAAAQVTRSFPREALRGELKVTAPPLAVLNGQAAQLAPGARVRSTDNMLVLSGALVGLTLKVNYTLDDRGDLKDVWILRDAEIERLWPRTPQDAARWGFDPIAQQWTKR